MRKLTRITIGIIVFAIMLSIQPVDKSEAHYNVNYIVNVTKFCMYLHPNFTICCDIDNYLEHNHYISPDDHVEALDENNEIDYPHIPGHQNHYRADVWNLWRADFNYVDGCSECD